VPVTDLAHGTDGQVLETVGTTPTWTTPSGGGGGSTVASRTTAIDGSTIHQWLLTEASAPYADTGTSAANMTLGGSGVAPLVRPGLFGTEIGLQGAAASPANTQVPTTASTAASPGSGAWTVHGWFAFHAYASAGFIVAFTDSGGNLLLLKANTDGNGQPVTNAQASMPGGTVTLTGGYPDNLSNSIRGARNHIALVYDGATTVTLYVNGRAVMSGTASFSGGYTSTGTWVIGDGQSAGAGNCAYGWFSDWRVESVARSQSYLEGVWRKAMSLGLLPPDRRPHVHRRHPPPGGRRRRRCDARGRRLACRQLAPRRPALVPRHPA
jgi:hypothetical protein